MTYRYKATQTESNGPIWGKIFCDLRLTHMAHVCPAHDARRNGERFGNEKYGETTWLTLGSRQVMMAQHAEVNG